MPTTFDDEKTPVVSFDVRLEVSPFLVFRRLRDSQPVELVDVRAEPKDHTLRGARRLDEEWSPPEDRMVVLFDDDGSEALQAAERFQEQGHTRVKALFGGLDLWRFSLDPEVVGEDTYLEEIA